MLKKLKGQRGMAAVEVAIVLPIFLGLLALVVESGSALNKHQVLTAAAREAGRYGTRVVTPRPSQSEVEQRARDYLTSSGLDSPNSTVTVTGAGGDSGSELSVIVTYPQSFPFLSMIVANFTSDSGTIDLTAEIVLELG